MPSPLALCVHIPKKEVGIFYWPTWISALGKWSKPLTETLLSQKPKPLLNIHSPCSLQLKTLSWLLDVLICSRVCPSCFPGLCAVQRPVIFFCGYSHTRALQCRGFKVSWWFSRAETFLQPEPRPSSLRSRRKPSNTLSDLLLLWFLCNQSCCCSSNETEGTTPLEPLEWKELDIQTPRVLIVFQDAPPPTCRSGLDYI